MFETKKSCRKSGGDCTTLSVRNASDLHSSHGFTSRTFTTIKNKHGDKNYFQNRKRVGKFIKPKTRFEMTSGHGGGRGNEGVVAYGYRILVVVMVAEHRDYN